MGRVRRSSESLLFAAAMVASLVGGVTAGEAGPAGAAITPRTDAAGALAISQALASSANVTGLSFLSTTGGTPNGTSNRALAGFPTDGSTFGILTSGNVSNIPNVGTFSSVSNGGASVRGDTDMDVSILKTDVSVPSGANCLTFDFKFLSEKFPNFVGGSVNDAFVAELDSSTWTKSSNTTTAPNNFAFDSAGQVVSINSTGVGGMTAADGAGAAFDGNTEGAGTGVLHASHQVTPGAHSLYFSIFDQGDTIYDSAVFLDNLRIGFVPNPAVQLRGGCIGRHGEPRPHAGHCYERGRHAAHGHRNVEERHGQPDRGRSALIHGDGCEHRVRDRHDQREWRGDVHVHGSERRHRPDRRLLRLRQHRTV